MRTMPRWAVRARTIPFRARGLILRLVTGSGSRLQAESLPRITALSGGTIRLGSRVKFHRGCSIHLYTATARLTVGDNTYFNDGCRIFVFESVVIGKNCAIAWDVHFSDSDQHVLDGKSHISPITLGDQVWVGARATILKGVQVGDGAVIAAGSLVASDVPAHALVAGVPAKILRHNVRWGEK